MVVSWVVGCAGFAGGSWVAVVGGGVLGGGVVPDLPVVPGVAVVGGGVLGGGVVPDLPVVPGVAVVGGGEPGGEVVPDLPAAAAAAVEVRGSDGGALAFAASVTFPLSPAMEAAPSMILPAAAAAFI
ncbi:hypothetical protein BZL29_8201 [Mycobacterium kansasii]|uniref:Uncharacterized protein n=1 Tax=Mycobacterium kansasii TaxID=1768 RepID=A0A1V3WBT0_MYCKA|nr:hypothetical protein BZL29_8201 [Mycobacterium kansasii]